MTGITGRFPARAGLKSYGCIGLEAGGDHPATLIGALDLRTVDVWFETVEADDSLSIRIHDEADGIDPRQLELPEIVRLEGPDLGVLLAEYGRLSGQTMQARPPRNAIRGWCSWYHYYGRETEKDTLAQAEKLLRSGLLHKGDLILIDDGWNLPNANAPRNWGDWEAGAKYPRGMRAVVESLNHLGLKAGLWLAPFSADAQSQLAAQHPEWLLKPYESTLLEEGDNPVYPLDLTHPGVRGFIEQTFRHVFDEWGFDFVKLDFLMHAMTPGPRHAPGLTRANAFHRALMHVREIAGERFILCCGSPLGPAVGAADAMRIGFDTGSRWHAPMLTELWPLGNCSILPAANATLCRQWMDGAWWMNDPDCLVVRSRANDYEVLQFDKKHPGGEVPASAFGLAPEEASLWTRLVRLSRCRILSEDIDELDEDRRALCRFVMDAPPLSSGRLVFDAQEHGCIGVIATDDTWFAAFNLSETPICPSFQGVPAGNYRECLTGEKLCIEKGTALTSPQLPPRTARLWLSADAQPSE
jgi:alpha-galactosidase